MLFKRYWVDIRVGCVAVRDYLIYDDHSGLHPDDVDVVKYWPGRLIDIITCEHCKHVRTEFVTNEEEKIAEDYCHQLNLAYVPDSTEIQTMFRVIRDFLKRQPKTLYLTQQIADYIMQEQNELYDCQNKGPLTDFCGVPVKYGHEFSIEAV